MNKGILIITALILAVTAQAGCDKDGGGSLSCVEMCERGNDCPGRTPSDCQAECSALQNMVNTAGCSSEYNDMVACANDRIDQICETTDLCPEESDATAQCWTTYCMSHTSDPICSLSCVELCERSNDCPGADQEDCPTACSQTHDIVDAAGCTSQYNDLQACGNDHVNQLCETPFPCETEGNVVEQCVNDYCLSHPTDPVCT